MKKYTTLLFDADNTLLDFDANEAFSFRAMLAELGETYTEELFQTVRMGSCGSRSSGRRSRRKRASTGVLPCLCGNMAGKWTDGSGRKCTANI